IGRCTRSESDQKCKHRVQPKGHDALPIHITGTASATEACSIWQFSAEQTLILYVPETFASPAAVGLKWTVIVAVFSPSSLKSPLARENVFGSALPRNETPGPGVATNL